MSVLDLLFLIGLGVHLLAHLLARWKYPPRSGLPDIRLRAIERRGAALNVLWVLLLVVLAGVTPLSFREVNTTILVISLIVFGMRVLPTPLDRASRGLSAPRNQAPVRDESALVRRPSRAPRSTVSESSTEPMGEPQTAPYRGSEPLTEAHEPAERGGPWQTGAVVLSEFEVVQELGRGGFGTVYLLRSRVTNTCFAVKRVLLVSDADRADFLAELETWFGLPKHPHLVACRFFRTIGDEVVIFAEHVEGGTLGDWIEDRRIRTLEQMLDVGIQFAWGLQAIHARDLVHQDVKPGNVLMTKEGVAKVADFGLARAGRRTALGRPLATGEESGEGTVKAKRSGYTRAYCSPEQLGEDQVSRRSDLWSWGVSVLDMFKGGVSCGNGGERAESELEDYLRTGPAEDGLPGMPPEVIEVLRRCFRKQPEDRWGDWDQVIDLLRAVYQKHTGRVYDRATPPPIAARSPAIQREAPRQSRGGAHWKDPEPWVRKACEAAGRDSVELGRFRRQQPSAGQAQADLLGYEEAYRECKALVAKGRRDLRGDLAELCHNKALVHQEANDPPGALALFKEATTLYEELITREARHDLSLDFAVTLVAQGALEHAMGDVRGSVDAWDQAIEILRTLTQRDARWDLQDKLAATCLNKAAALVALGDLAAADALYDQAIEIRQRLLEHRSAPEIEAGLALACMGKANLSSQLNKGRSSLPLYDQAINLLAPLATSGAPAGYADRLATVYQNQAVTLSALGEKRRTVEQYEKSIRIREDLLSRHDSPEVRRALAEVGVNQAHCLHELGDLQKAIPAYDRAISHWEQLVRNSGRSDLAPEWARALCTKGIAHASADDPRKAADAFDAAIVLLEGLVVRGGRLDLRGDLALARGYRAMLRAPLGDLRRARVDLTAAIAELEREVEQGGRADLKQTLAQFSQTAQGLRAVT